MRMKPLLVLAGTLALVGCGGGAPMRMGVPPLQPIPTAPVTTTQLPPPVTPVPTPTPTPTPDVVAAAPAVPDPGAALELRRPDVSGVYTIASGGESCTLVISLTSWTGGYRANTRGCGSDELKAIGAWDLNGKEIVLKDASGSAVARLYATAPTRFSGQTLVSGRGVQVFR